MKSKDGIDEFIENELEFLCGILGTKLEKQPQNQQQMKKQFKEGDEVWDRALYPGMEGKVVISNTTQITANVFVRFGSRVTRTYHKNGSTTENGIQTLFHHDYEIELKPVEVKFEKDELVLVRDSEDQNWKVRRFNRIFDGKYLAYESKYGAHMAWEHCIKFDVEKILRVTKD